MPRSFLVKKNKKSEKCSRENCDISDEQERRQCDDSSTMVNELSGDEMLDSMEFEEIGMCLKIF